MARDFSRTDRIAEQIKREIAQMLQVRIKDTGLALVTISAVKVSKDLAYADLYFTSLSVPTEGEPSALAAERKLCEKSLNALSGELRTALAQTLHTRVTPQLRFQYDISLDRGQRLTHLIEKAVRGRVQPHAEDD